MVQTDRSATKKAGGEGVIFISPGGKTLKYAVRLQFLVTNNEVEYETLLTGLKLAKMLGSKDLIVQVNSQLVINQVREDYDVKKERM